MIYCLVAQMVQAVIQADYYIRSGDAKKILVVGADVLSRISDPRRDRDSVMERCSNYGS